MLFEIIRASGITHRSVVFICASLICAANGKIWNQVSCIAGSPSTHDSTHSPFGNRSSSAAMRDKRNPETKGWSDVSPPGSWYGSILYQRCGECLVQVVSASRKETVLNEQCNQVPKKGDQAASALNGPQHGGDIGDLCDIRTLLLQS
jgi:hypothetical protein